MDTRAPAEYGEVILTKVASDDGAFCNYEVGSSIWRLFSVRRDAISTICLFDDIVSIMAEYHDVSTRIPASYLIGPGFISHLGSHGLSQFLRI